jgi:hypothetical protein
MNTIMALLPCILAMLIGAIVTGILVKYANLPTFLVYQVGYIFGFVGLLIALWEHINWF